ncbi:putative membrane protein [Streptomyces sp. Amel2xB2]|uniref:alpha/beta hydrolase n=1 Tax=Streptomyces sp. Amel2xB2 TaxID=1305829 RepID=UPI000DB9789E|nr:alpha/beta hydrolase [Streptomyces sp. Amel2xB2]RAJ71611.1 putative membrane protein [Streptomyces sp. Amel2xB2]
MAYRTAESPPDGTGTETSAETGHGESTDTGTGTGTHTDAGTGTGADTRTDTDRGRSRGACSRTGVRERPARLPGARRPLGPSGASHAPGAPVRDLPARPDAPAPSRPYVPGAPGGTPPPPRLPVLRRTLRAAASRALAAARHPYRPHTDPARVVRRWPDLTAACFATLFFWLSLTPSLVPRPWLLQGVIGGITAAIGYGIGAPLGRLARLALVPVCRRLLRRTPGERARARAWQTYYVAALGLTVLALSESARMQRQLRALQDLPETLTWHSMMITVLALTLCAALLLLARAIRLGTRALIRNLCRFVPRPVAVVAGLLISATAVVVGTRDVVFDRGVVDVVARVAESTDRGTKDGVVQSGSRFVSGSPGSLITWPQLGYEGRNFTGSTPTARRISHVTHRPAREPVRVYVGRRAFEGGAAGGTTEAESYAAGAQLAVAELERTGAFDREVLAVAGTTGMGWVNSADAEPLEFLHGGDTAIVAMQYSYLPSWLSFVVDKEQAGRANRALVTAVRERWLQEPADSRPRLYVFGESLGAYGVEAAFDGPDDLLSKVDGAVLAGSPNFSPIREEITAHRDAGSPVWRPRYERGRHFRFAQWPARDLARPPGPWHEPRVAYLQNASDPIVWWSWDLALERPRWLSEPLGPDITREVGWFPFVTFWQTTVDLAVSYDVDAPHGHRYGSGSVEAWSAVAPPQDWDAADHERLKRYMEERKSPY